MGSYQPPAETSRITEMLKKAAAALRDAQIDFALAGSVACWARGGPAPCNDVDFAIRAGGRRPARARGDGDADAAAT